MKKGLYQIADEWLNKERLSITSDDLIKAGIIENKEPTQSELWHGLLLYYDQQRMIRRGLKEVAKDLENNFSLTRKQ